MPSRDVERVQLQDGREVEVVAAFMGAEGRYEDWVYLKMLEREWRRPDSDGRDYLDIPVSSRPSAKAVIVLVFWTYFETRIERLIRESVREMPAPVVEDLLGRYWGIGARMERLYRILFGHTYWRDLEDAGFGHVANFLRNLQGSRNAFAHGHPEAITDEVVEALVRILKEEHEGWISVFNRRATRVVTPPPGSVV